MSKQYDVAVLGATGVVGQTAIAILQARNFPIRKLYPLASARSAGMQIQFNNETLTVLDVETFDFAQAQIAIFSAGASVSLDYAPRAAKAGCVVIDNTTAFRYEDDIPLVVPEVNAAKIRDYQNRHIIANPNCSTIQMVTALKPIYDAVGIRKINFVSYQSTSGAGREGVDELLLQTEQVLQNQPVQPLVFKKQIAFNVIPQIDEFQPNGFTKEEMKVVWETQKIFADPHIQINPTAVRVPVCYGHSESVTIETKQKITPQQVRELLQKAPGVCVYDDPSQQIYPTPLLQGTGTDDVFVGRIREDLTNALGINLWIVADNVRKGAALNAVQIAEQLIKLW